jgi:hypothetical protein
MTSEEKVRRALEIIRKVEDFDWQHADHCPFKDAPWNECPTKECSPLHHIKKILETGSEEANDNVITIEED